MAALFLALGVVMMLSVDGAVPQSRVKRVIGGVEVQQGDWPWLVSLQAKIPDRTLFGIPISYRIYYCGASVLNEYWILTAAHCIPIKDMGEKAKKPKYYHARLGDVSLDSSLFDKVKGWVGKFLNVNEWRDWYIHADKIIIHPEYNPKQYWKNDIALIRLEEPVPTGDEIPEIRNIKLPAQSEMRFPANDQECIMKGWGCTEKGGRVSKKAMATILPKVSDEECYRFWYVDINTRLCAGYNLQSKGICPGDSGGPLVCKNSTSNDWVQVGIASFSSANRPGQVPGAFTRTSNYINWIRDTIQNNSD